MGRRAFSQSLTLWMYVSICGAAILLLHSGPGSHFWMLMLSAGASWLGLGRLGPPPPA